MAPPTSQDGTGSSGTISQAMTRIAISEEFAGNDTLAVNPAGQVK